MPWASRAPVERGGTTTDPGYSASNPGGTAQGEEGGGDKDRGKGDKGKEKGKNGGKPNSPDQDRVIQIAKEAKKNGGLTPAAAELLRRLAEAAEVLFRGPESHPNRPYGSRPHIHVGPVGHIPIK